MRDHKAILTFTDDLVTRDELRSELLILRQSLTLMIGGMLAAGLGLLFAALKSWP